MVRFSPRPTQMLCRAGRRKDVEMPVFDTLPPELAEQIRHDKHSGRCPRVGFDDACALRREKRQEDETLLWQPAFVYDIQKILNCPFFHRYTDKTQVFSLFKNDDISRRSLHVQLVSRIARTIGSALNLNLDLIEAIALGHDIGHSPFAHAGEHYLDEIVFAHTGRHFDHAVHSARVLDGIFPYNITLQTLNGIVSHNVVLDRCEYHPRPVSSFEEFDRQIVSCDADKTQKYRIAPATLEAYVVRISDIIAYVGKDRYDAEHAGFISQKEFSNEVIGSTSEEIINNMTVNIIVNSYGKPYIGMDAAHLEALMASRAENYRKIYNHITAMAHFDTTVKPMMAQLYDRLLSDLMREDRTSPIFTHHIDYVNREYTRRKTTYEDIDPHRIVVDYIASMTDDYFVDLYRVLFPDSPIRVSYRDYFE